MSHAFASAEDAFLVLCEPADPAWGAAFAFLAARPETAPLMLEIFRETLDQMGVAPSGTDPETGDPTYRVEDVARAMGVPAESLVGAEETGEASEQAREHPG